MLDVCWRATAVTYAITDSMLLYIMLRRVCHAALRYFHYAYAAAAMYAMPLASTAYHTIR